MEETNKYSNYFNPENYILVGSSYYKKVLIPDAFGNLEDSLVRWDREQIRADFHDNPEDKKKIDRYDGFVCVPMHLNYQRRISNFYNLYEDIGIIPEKGDWKTIEKLLRHIFGNQYEEGLDYLQLLFLRPLQKLPILLIISRERNTGKTTFLNFVKDIFKKNMTFVSNEDMRSRFNSDWAEKLIVAIDETLLNRKEDSERIKALSTARTYKMEAKGRDRREIVANIKLILCSNNAEDPVYIDSEEDRYWVRQVDSLEEKEPDMPVRLKAEIPAFVEFLLTRTMKHPKPQERMWFRMKDLETPALAHIKRMCGPKGEMDLAEMLLSIMDAYNLDNLSLTKGNIVNQLGLCHININNLHDILAKRWAGKIEPPKENTNYIHYQVLDGQPVSESGTPTKGRIYRFTRKFLESIVKDDEKEVLDDLPEDDASTLFP